jgi:non-reducing end alpha-L-arabinofuranosidase
VTYVQSSFKTFISFAIFLLAVDACSSNSNSPNAGGSGSSGGTTQSTGGKGSGGSTGTGGAVSSGGKTSVGGSLGAGGTTGKGGSAGAGGTSGQGQSGGSSGNGGTSRAGGAGGGGNGSGGNSTGSGGDSNHTDAAAGGQTVSGGTHGTGGTISSGGTSGAVDSGAGGSTALTGPCDIYGSGNTPCVAAHSTVRALYGTYSGNLYQVRRASDKATKDIVALTAGGYADSATQDTFCSGTTCTISEIYDQSPKGNHLLVTEPGGWLTAGGKESNATAAKIKMNGHTVYGVYIESGDGYRNNKTSGIATGDEPESMYMVASGKNYNDKCCFDYGNAETNSKDNGNGTMEAIYFGNCTSWGSGSGTGPWVMADLENGLFTGLNAKLNAANTSVSTDYVTALIKGKAGKWGIKVGDSQSGTLKTMYEGARPANGYDPMKKEGAIVLGTGGDNSWAAVGTFFEGVMTTGYPTDATEDAVQANIVAAGYGR